MQPNGDLKWSHGYTSRIYFGNNFKYATPANEKFETPTGTEMGNEKQPGITIDSSMQEEIDKRVQAEVDRRMKEEIDKRVREEVEKILPQKLEEAMQKVRNNPQD